MGECFGMICEEEEVKNVLRGREAWFCSGFSTCDGGEGSA